MTVALAGDGHIEFLAVRAHVAFTEYASFFCDDSTFAKDVFFGCPGWDSRDAHALATAGGGCDYR